MASPPPLPEDMRDTEQLRLLAILHYVAAGLGFLGLLFVWGHYALMRTMSGVFEEGVKKAAAETEKEKVLGASLPGSEEEVARFSTELSPDFFDGVFDFVVYIYLAVAALIVLKIILNLMSARWITRRKGRVFSMVVAALNCLSLPLGTALGIFTFVVLSRPSVSGAYREQ